MTLLSVLVILCAGRFFSGGLDAQVLKRHVPPSACPPALLRATARANDGHAVGSLVAHDLDVSFYGSPATVLSLQDEAPRGTSTPNTDVLYVIPPYSGVNADTVRQIMQANQRADNFRWNSAVLAPDGAVSSFTMDSTKQQKHLLRAIGTHLHPRTRSQWPLSEERAFLALRGQPGRHVIVILTNQGSDYRSVVKREFRHDGTLVVLGSFDMAQIYRLARPLSLSTTIPMGDASTQHIDIGPENHGFQQLQDAQQASENQQALLAEQSEWQATGGRTETSLDTLLQDIVEDAQGSYELLIQGGKGCRPGGFYPVSVKTHIRTIRLFAPDVVQLLPEPSPSESPATSP